MRNQSTYARSSIWLALLFVPGLGGIAPLAHAQGPALEAVQLVPAIVETVPSNTARGVFYEQRLAATLPAGPVLLASSPDGLGWLCTDDRATLMFSVGDQPLLTWAHRFASADRRAIECLPPQRLELPLAATYQITVTLDDLYPTTSSSRPYYLVFAAVAASPVAATAPAAPPVGSAAAPPGATATSVIVPAANARPAVVATNIPASMPTVMPEPPGPPVEAAPGQDRRWLALAIGLVLLVLVAWVLWWRLRRPAAAVQALTGILYLFDQETREAHTALVRGTHQLDIRRRPLQVVPVANRMDQGIAQIQPSLDGLVLYEPATGAGVPLVHDRLYTLAGGAVTLRYREPGGRRPGVGGQGSGVGNRPSVVG